MSAFWGCDTEAMQELTAALEGGVVRLERVAAIVASGLAIAWSGRDATRHRERVGAVRAELDALIRVIADQAGTVRAEAEQQSEASAAQRSAVLAELPWDGAPWFPPLREGPPKLRPHPGWGPWLGGPFMRERPPPPPFRERHLPEGEEFALDPELLEKVARERRTVAGHLPFLGIADSLLGTHAVVGTRLDSAEAWLEEAGLEALSPAVAAARIPHALSSVAFGENSVMAQMASGVDHQLANAVQSTQEISAALGDGDLAAAARAGERGLFRHAEGAVRIITAGPAPALIDASSQASGAAADLVEPFAPGAATPLRLVEEAGAGVEHHHRTITDAERFYDGRRRALPLPWDPVE